MLVSNPRSKRVDKLGVIWKGPRRIVECCNDCIFVVEDLVSGNRQRFHSRRMRVFRAKDAVLLEAWKDQAAYDDEGYVLDEIQDFRVNSEGELELEVTWAGLDFRTWESVEAMIDEDPGLVCERLNEILEDDDYEEELWKVVKRVLETNFGKRF